MRFFRRKQLTEITGNFRVVEGPLVAFLTPKKLNECYVQCDPDRATHFAKHNNQKYFLENLTHKKYGIFMYQYVFQEALKIQTPHSMKMYLHDEKELRNISREEMIQISNTWVIRNK